MNKKVTTEDFIRRAKEVHGDRYDYSKAEYINATTKVCIICPEHGEFWQTPNNHIHGTHPQNCPKCVGGVRSNVDDFVKKAKEIHGDKYNYSKVEYKNNRTKVCIICPEHGEFWQTPDGHLSGCGCPKCADLQRIKVRSSTTEEFIKKAKEIHGDRYDYSKVKYTKALNKVCIICPEHGEFWQTANAHLGGAKCPKCVGGVRLNTSEFINKAHEVHGDKYDYSKVNYINSVTKVHIICPEHGEFWQTPNTHLSGRGCPKCGGNEQLTTEEFIRRAKEVHGDRYDYSKTVYTKAKEKVCIICPEHGEFWQEASSHLSGAGCPKCVGRMMGTKEWIERAKLVHGDRYDYSKVEYIDSATKVCIVCPKHGEFWQMPSSHLAGNGCKKCANEELSDKKRLSLDDFLKKAREIHGDRYDYSKVNYNSAHEKVCIICPKHGEFWQEPASHLSGCGCPNCQGLRKDNKLKLLTEYDLASLSINSLLELIADNVLPSEFKKLIYSEPGTEKRKNTIKELKEFFTDPTLDDDEVETILSKEIKEEEDKFEKEHAKGTDTIDTPADETEEKELPSSGSKLKKELDVLNGFGDKLFSLGNKGEFLMKVKMQEIWNQVLKDDDEKSTDFIKYLRDSRKIASDWFKYVIDEFLKEYKEVKAIKQDSEYAFKKSPKLMQKLMIYKMLNNDCYLNLCGTGAGKTNAFLMATKAVGSNVNVIICPNSVIGSWEKAIKAIYPNSNVEVYESNRHLDFTSKDNLYVIINYDKFSNGPLSSVPKMNKFIDEVNPQFICLDEIHNAKARSEKASCRHENLMHFMQRSRKKHGEGFKTLGMTATPLINNLREVRSLLELVTGKNYSDIGNRNTIGNVHLAYKNLMLNGFRFIPNYGIKVNDIDVKVDGSSLKDSIIEYKNSEVNSIEGEFIDLKMDAIKNELTTSTIIYSTYIENLVPRITKKLKEFGISFGRYTGTETREEREYIFEQFSEKKFDVLVASAPISTGVDGLQEFCNRIVLVSLPWTNAEYTQLIGRINRQGSKFDSVDVVFPHIDIELEEGNVWSWDKRRMDIIKRKRTLSDVVVDGNFSYTAAINRKKLMQGAIEALRSGKAIEDFNHEREDAIANPIEEDITREHADSIVNNMHRKANTSKSSTTHKFFKENPDEWRKYHEARDLRRAEWTEDPQDVIASKINELSGYGIIADLGCGRNELKGKITTTYSKWLSFDHVANDDSVIAADTTDLSAHVKDGSLDVAIYCLSLWGTNKEDYFKEASRMLKVNGVAYIAEPKDVVMGELVGMAAKYNLDIYGMDNERPKFNYLTLRKIKG